MAKVLLFNISGEKRMKIDFLLMQYGIESREAASKEYGQPLGRLLGKDEYTSVLETGQPFSEEMLVMDELSSQQFHGLLNGMKMLQAQVVLKAITTPQNLSWTPARLYHELSEEHAAMTGASL